MHCNWENHLFSGITRLFGEMMYSQHLLQGILESWNSEAFTPLTVRRIAWDPIWLTTKEGVLYILDPGHVCTTEFEYFSFLLITNLSHATQVTSLIDGNLLDRIVDACHIIKITVVWELLSCLIIYCNICLLLFPCWSQC